MKATRQLALTLVAILAIGFSACSDDDDYYYSPLIGDWVLVEDDYGPVTTDQNIYQFYSDGTGIYVDYDWDNQYTYNIYWEPSGSLLYISFNDGQQWTYRWNISGNYLYLTDLDTGSNLTFQMY